MVVDRCSGGLSWPRGRRCSNWSQVVDSSKISFFQVQQLEQCMYHRRVVAREGLKYVRRSEVLSISWQRLVWQKTEQLKLGRLFNVRMIKKGQQWHPKWTFVLYDSDTMINYQLFQKSKILRTSEVNHLIIILTLSLMCGFRLPLNEWDPTHVGFFF